MLNSIGLFSVSEDPKKLLAVDKGKCRNSALPLIKLAGADRLTTRDMETGSGIQST